MTERAEAIAAWQGYFADLGLMTFPLFGVMNGKCRCRDGADCKNPGKHPKIKGWRNLAEPFKAGEMDNLGVSTDHLVVVDVDVGEIPDDLPETFTVSTGRGYHLWYWANHEHPISNAAGWRPKIDIRSVGGLVAAPPSRHVSGSWYEYVGGEIQPVPDLVLETQRRYVQRERKDQVTHVPESTSDLMRPLVDALILEMSNAVEGERNHTLFRVLCRFFELAENGWAGEDALRELFDAAVGIGLSPSEVVATIESASRSLTK